MNKELIRILTVDEEGSERNRRTTHDKFLTLIGLLEGCSLDVNPSWHCWFNAEGSLKIGITSFEELPKVREFYRALLGSWLDKVGSPREYVSSKGIVDYKSEKFPNFSIQVIFKKEDTPKSFFKNDECGWEKHSFTSEYESFVCKV